MGKHGGDVRAYRCIVIVYRGGPEREKIFLYNVFNENVYKKREGIKSMGKDKELIHLRGLLKEGFVRSCSEDR